MGSRNIACIMSSPVELNESLEHTPKSVWRSDARRGVKAKREGDTGGTFSVVVFC